MAQQSVLDLRWIRVEPTDDEHVLDPAHDAQVACTVDDAKITGPQPTLRRQRRRSRLGIIKVVRHDARSAHQDFTRFATRDLIAVAVHDANVKARPPATHRRRDDLEVVLR